MTTLLSIPDVCARLGRVSKNHVYRLIASGELEATDISNPDSTQSKTRVPDASLERFIERRTRRAGQKKAAAAVVPAAASVPNPQQRNQQ